MTDPDPSRAASQADTFTANLRAVFRRTFGRFLGEPEDNKQELLETLREAQAQSVIDADAVSMMEGVLQVADLTVADLMVPRAQMDVIDIGDPIDKILAFVLETSHSRFPVIQDQKDDVIGILLAKDLLRVLRQPNLQIRSLLRPAIFVPESKRLNLLLRDFRLNRNHLAIAVDEYGGVSGLITIEDVLEQIVGDIEDEHDIDEASQNIRPLPSFPGRFWVQGSTPLAQFNEAFGVSLSDELVETVGGYVVTEMGRVPQRGEHFEATGLDFEIQRTNGRAIDLMLVERLPEPSPADDTVNADA